MPAEKSRLSWAGLRITSLGILTSRVLGMVREMATAALLGMSGGGVMDAFVVAFRLPNAFRRLFGEGALAIAYLPVFTAAREEDPRAAARLATVVLSLLAILLAVLVLVGEFVCLGLWYATGDNPSNALVLGLSAVMLPYLLFICVAAQVSATLYAVGEFTVPAMAPAFLNICWLGAVWFVAPWWSQDRQQQAYVIAWAITVAGIVQLVVQLPALRRHGVGWDYHWAASRARVMQIVRTMAPVMVGLAATQLNTFIDSLTAWILTAENPAETTIAWLGGLQYPMRAGAASAIYYGERLYQFPQGMLGIAVATVVFPLLSRHAARGHFAQLGEDLTMALRLIVYTALPASAGLVLLAEPITRLLFEHGAFTADDTRRTARVIAVYGSGVWAYCALPVVMRGFYALGDQMSPLRVSLWGMPLNIALNLMLVWPFAEAGLACGTVIVSSLQVLVLAITFSLRNSPIGWRSLAGTLVRTLLATTVMSLAVWWALSTASTAAGLVHEFWRVAWPLGLSIVVYWGMSVLCGLDEWRLLLSRGRAEEEGPATNGFE